MEFWYQTTFKTNKYIFPSVRNDISNLHAKFGVRIMHNVYKNYGGLEFNGIHPPRPNFKDYPYPPGTPIVKRGAKGVEMIIWSHLLLLVSREKS